MACFNLGQIENIVDQPEQVVATVLNVVQEGFALLIRDLAERASALLQVKREPQS